MIGRIGRIGRPLLALALVAAISIVASAGAAALIDGGDIRNGSIGQKDLAKKVRKKLNGAGTPGATGSQGPAGASALSPVPSGQTIRGVIGGDFHAFDASASDFGVDMTLPVPAANGLSDTDVEVNVASWQDGGGQTAPTTTDTDPSCNGTPSAPVAPPGTVCIYVSGADHAFNLNGYSVLFGTGPGSPYGFKLKWDASQPGDTFVDATWAYQAP